MRVHEILEDYPTLDAGDVLAAWEYAGVHQAEIDEQIRENTDAE